MLKKSIFLIMITFIFLVTGCSSKNELPQLTKHIKPTMHELGSIKLKGIMHELNNLVFERFYSELERDDLRVQHTKEIAQIAHSIAGDVQKIESMSSELKLNKTELAEFMKLTKELGSNAVNLENIAENYRIKEIKGGINKLVATCNSCHQKFRKDSTKVVE